ncbi:uncharacterized protein Bfra_008157 [Botrytis fragariae]|uniref:Uncharacterized protein n=1 Tax=Botrytis fragariae TaxID=1964551 RepID=A0A8H6EHY9_9HELO|nr:uncharacterized protein Bfra_008157 [Botrytis fragariae]KAF5872881.1 hypothetical protein Bfra_008157 [Botrytis fragariae]
MRTIYRFCTVGVMMGNATLVSLLGIGMLCPVSCVLCVQILSAQLPYQGLNISQCVRRSLFAAFGNRSTPLHEAL